MHLVSDQFPLGTVFIKFIQSEYFLFLVVIEIDIISRALDNGLFGIFVKFGIVIVNVFSLLIWGVM